MFNDTDTYMKINKNPIKKLTNDIRVMLAGWKTKEYITQGTYNSIYCSDGNLPRAYRLPKIHKPGLKFRLIISSIDSPIHLLAEFLHTIITKNIIKPPSHINNSYQLVHKLNGTHIGDDFELISLDVISLFTNIPMNLTLDSVNKRWLGISKSTKIPKSDFLKVLKLFLNRFSSFSMIRLQTEIRHVHGLIPYLQY